MFSPRDGRPENYEILRRRWSWIDVRLLDLDDPDPEFREVAEVVYCYGTLYHLSRPAEALAQMARWCTSLLLLETCVSTGAADECIFIDEPEWRYSQALRGRGVRPTRLWVHRSFSEHFEYVYVPTTQPWHPEFPTDWTSPVSENGPTRAIFVASRQGLENRRLTTEIPLWQRAASPRDRPRRSPPKRGSKFTTPADRRATLRASLR